jgi:hypothetical protein
MRSSPPRSSRAARAASASALLAGLLGASSLPAQPVPTAPANPFTSVSRWTPPPMPVGKKPITQDTYDEWRTISGSALSNNGQWVAYTLSPVVGEGELVVRATTGTTEYRAPRGFTGRPQLQPAADSAAQFSAAPPQFSANSRFVAYTIYPSRTEVERARARRGTPPPRNGMGLMDLASGELMLMSAGHEDPLHIRADGSIAIHKLDGGPPFCIVDFPYPDEPMKLAPGESLVLISDGVSEALNGADQLFGHDRLLAALAGRTTATAMVEGICDAVRAFEDGTDPTDDLTVMAVRYLG